MQIHQSTNRSVYFGQITYQSFNFHARNSLCQFKFFLNISNRISSSIRRWNNVRKCRHVIAHGLQLGQQGRSSRSFGVFLRSSGSYSIDTSDFGDNFEISLMGLTNGVLQIVNRQREAKFDTIFLNFAYGIGGSSSTTTSATAY